MMSAQRLVITTGSKGGTGKSVTARYLAYRYEISNVDATLVDADQDVGQLAQYYEDQAIQIRPDDTAEIISIVEQADSPVVLLDMPGRGLEDLKNADLAASLFQWLSENRVSLTMINAVTPYRASTYSVGKMLDLIGDAEVATVALLNGNFGPNDRDWVLWNGSPELEIEESRSRRRFLSAGGIELYMPILETSVLVLLDLKSETFSTALSSSTSSLKTAHYKQYLRTWLRLMDRTFRPIERILGL